MAFTKFGNYCYCAWAAKDPLTTGPWEAWFEIHTTDQQTMLSGPTRLLTNFADGEAACAAAEEAARQEILSWRVGP